MSSTTQPCENCGSNKWKTIKKHISWKCRNCGQVRSLDSKEAENNG